MGHLFLVKNLLGRGEETVAWRSSRDASLPSTREFGERRRPELEGAYREFVVTPDLGR